ncbi:MAG: hypothetical protein ACP5IX_01755 [Patescibacteria group bacterium]
MFNFRENPSIEKIPEGKVEKEKLPEMEVTFLYTPHGTEEDARLIRENLKNFDVFVPENKGWSEEDLRDFSKISQGDKKILEDYKKKVSEFNEFVDFWFSLLESIYNSKKIIWLVDIKKEQYLELEEILKIDEKSRTLFSMVL